MVSLQRRDGRDRAQLVLVGSIAIAFIVIGLVVVFNTVLFTENIAARGSVEQVEEASEFQQQVERDVPRLVRGVENDTDSNDDVVNHVDENVSVTYSRLLAETYVDGGAGYVDVSFDASESRNGTYVVQDEETRSFTNDNGSADWTVASGHDVENFTMQVPVDSLSEESSRNFTVVLDGDSGGSVEVEIWRDSTSGDMQLNQTGDTDNPTCDISGTAGTTVEVNVSSGTTDAGTCSFDGLDTLSSPYTIEFSNGDQTEGEYDLVAHGFVDQSDYNDRDGSSSPYVVYFIREANLDLTYETGSVSYESNRTVTVREGAP